MGLKRTAPISWSRLRDLGNRNGGKLAFAYTGAYDPRRPRREYRAGGHRPLRQHGSHRAWNRRGVPAWMGRSDGNDMRNLPTGLQTLRRHSIRDSGPGGERTAGGACACRLRKGFPVARRGAGRAEGERRLPVAWRGLNRLLQRLRGAPSSSMRTARAARSICCAASMWPGRGFPRSPVPTPG